MTEVCNHHLHVVNQIFVQPSNVAKIGSNQNQCHSTNMAWQSSLMRVGVLSKVPNLLNQIVKRLPELETSITDRLAKTGLTVNEILNSPLDGLGADVAKQVAGDCNILVADPDLLGPFIYNLNDVKWVQSTWDGVDALAKFIKHDKPYPELKLTRFAVFGQHMAEYVIGHIIAMERNFRKLSKDQKNHEWRKSVGSYRLLNKLTIGLIGVGEIGCSIAMAAKHFGMEVHGIVSKEIPINCRKPFVDKYYFSLQQLPKMLESCDYVCNTLPKTTKTNGVLMGSMLKNCKEKQSIFINIGRGNVIRDCEIVKALTEKWIGGAILDVFEEEPLPKSSPLWGFDNVTITPHCSGLSMDDEIADFFAKNLKCYIHGNEPGYVVDWCKGY